MLIKFCDGWINPAQVEAIMPSKNGDGYMIVTRSRNIIYLSATREEIEQAADAVNLLAKEGSTV